MKRGVLLYLVIFVLLALPIQSSSLFGNAGIEDVNLKRVDDLLFVNLTLANNDVKPIVDGYVVVDLGASFERNLGALAPVMNFKIMRAQ